MHPTAVLLALRGCVPLTLGAHRRIATQQADFTWALYAPMDAKLWAVGRLGAITQYEPASWDITTDAEWDQLSPEMLAEFLA